MSEYRVPFEDGESEFTEKRSRFISHIWRVETEAQARERIEQMRKQYYDARHNCWAYCAGAAGSTDRCVFRERHPAQSSNPAALRYSNQRR